MYVFQFSGKHKICELFKSYHCFNSMETFLTTLARWNDCETCEYFLQPDDICANNKAKPITQKKDIPSDIFICYVGPTQDDFVRFDKP